MTAASDGGAQRRTPRAAGAQLTVAKQTSEQRCADVAAAQEFHQIQKFAAACRLQWPGAKIVLRPDSDRGRESGLMRGEPKRDKFVRGTNLGNCKFRASPSPPTARISSRAAEKREQMESNELKDKQETFPLGGTEAENILGAAQEDAGFEKLLKFKKGEYFIGEDQVLLGTEYIAHAIAWTKCWIKFVDGDVVERNVYRVAKNERPPEREDLDDLEKDNWPEGIDGNPADRGLFNICFRLRASDGEIVIFTTSSFGGRRAVGDVCTA